LTVPHRASVTAGRVAVLLLGLSASSARAEGAPAAAAALAPDGPLVVASSLGNRPHHDGIAPSSQPAPGSQPAFRLRFTTAALAPQSQPALDLELHQQPQDHGPRFHRAKPFVELLSYQVFLTGAGWLYGNSPLDWRKPTWEGWKYRVSHAPLWHDGDPWTMNYLGHAVFGSDHYLMARNCGWSWSTSVLFNTFGSFFWEYVTEGLFERPSAIDLVTTPILGSILGEVRYQLFRLVRKKWDRRWYGYALMALLDPTTMFFEMWGWK
jgi:hypothetical protein